MPDMPAGALVRRFPLLAFRDLRLLLAERLLAPAAFAFSLVGVSFAVLDSAHHSTSELSVVLAAQIAPSLVFTLLGGVIADRLPPQRVLLAANALIALGEGSFGLLVLLGRPQLGQMIALEAVTGTGLAIFYPASQALLPRLVPAGFLQSASAVSRLAMNGGQMTGAVLAGFCVAAFGPGWALLTCGAGMVLSIPLMLSIRATVLRPGTPAVPTPAAATPPDAAPAASSVSTRATAPGLAAPATATPSLAAPVTASPADGLPRASLLRDVREGWSEFRSHTWLWATTLQFAVVLMAWYGGFQVLGPVVARTHLGGPRAWGLIAAAESVGLIAGGLASLRFTPRRPVLFVALAGGLIALAPLALASPWPLAVICFTSFTLGGAVEAIMVQWTVTMARQIPPDMLARVSGYDGLGSMMAMPVGALVAGPVAAAVGVRSTEYGAAVLIVGATALVLLSREVRQLRSGPPAPGGADMAPATEVVRTADGLADIVH